MIPIILLRAKIFCPHCGHRHIEEKQGPHGERWDRRAHTTHRCSNCGGHFDVFASGADDAEMQEVMK